MAREKKYVLLSNLINRNTTDSASPRFNQMQRNLRLAIRKARRRRLQALAQTLDRRLTLKNAEINGIDGGTAGVCPGSAFDLRAN
jgi:hypothetical protein